MCVTTEVDAKDYKGFFKGNADPREAVAKSHGVSAGDQLLPGEKRGARYVSRLQCVQAAIEQHIRHISQNNPGYRIGLVTFNDEVTIVGMEFFKFFFLQFI